MLPAAFLTLSSFFAFVVCQVTIQLSNKLVEEAVRLYNGKRLHRSVEMQTPNEAHKTQKHQYATYRKQKTAA